MIAAIDERTGAEDQEWIDERSSGPDRRSPDAPSWGPGRVATVVLLGVVLACGVRAAQWILLAGHPGSTALARGFLQSFLAACAWALVGWGVFRLARRVPLRGDGLIVAVPLHLAGAGAAGLAVNILAGAAWLAAGLQPASGGPGSLVIEQTLAHLHANALLYAVLVVAASTRAAPSRSSVEASGNGVGSAEKGPGAPACAAAADDADSDSGAAEDHASDSGADRTRSLERLAVPDGARTVVLPVMQIDWIEADGDYVSVHAGGRDYLLSERMHVLEDRLDPASFARVHRSAIVNLARVREIRPEAGGNATLALGDGTLVPLARRRRAEVVERLGV